MTIRNDHSSKQPTRSMRGFMLIECLVYFTVFFLVTALAFSVYYRATESSRLVSRSADDIGATMRAGERWRQDVRSATAPIGITDTDGSQTITIAHQAGVTRYRFSQGVLSRQTNDDSGWATMLTGIKSSSMAQETRRRVSVCRWDLELNPRSKAPHVRPLFTFEAVPGIPAKP